MAFLSGSAGPMEMIVIFLLILVLFGPRRLPEIAKMIGKTLHELRRASEDFKDQVMAIETDVVEAVDPTKHPDFIEDNADDDFEDPAEVSESTDSYDWSDQPDDQDPYVDDYDSEMHEESADEDYEDPAVNALEQGAPDDKSNRDISS